MKKKKIYKLIHRMMDQHMVQFNDYSSRIHANSMDVMALIRMLVEMEVCKKKKKGKKKCKK